MISASAPLNVAHILRRLLPRLVSISSRTAKREQRKATHLKHKSVVATIASASPATSMPAIKRAGVLGSWKRKRRLLTGKGAVLHILAGAKGLSLLGIKNP